MGQLKRPAKFSGAAAAGNGKIIFAPHHADSVGIFDPADYTFRLVDISEQYSKNCKFSGAAPVANGEVVFAPLDNDSVGNFHSAFQEIRLPQKPRHKPLMLR